MMNQLSSSLRQRRQELLAQLPSLEHLLRGSLIERYKRCGKPGCKCAKTHGHGPKFYLSVSFPGKRPAMDYVPKASVKEVGVYLDNFRLVRRILEEICEINRELLRRREAI